jgi:hypothetical protein
MFFVQLPDMSATGQEPNRRFWNYRPCSQASELSAMFINSVHVDVVGEAYHIAANYLKNTGRMPDQVDIHQPLLASIVEDYRAGRRNKLILANRAIARIEKTNVRELVS